ncbi:DUF969 domain-containing protein [Aeromonas enteropelogenes]|uniref:DUF969 domain-containing protein n=1 Tax=Aeromonas enteropelogenes TaxID=29489 RepID=UPI003BA29B67
MEWIKLSGILIILVGFYFKLDTLAVVLVAAVTTALVSGLSLTECLTLLGEAFVSNRMVTLFLLTLPMIGLCERYGLRQQAVTLIERIKQLTPGKFMTLYMFIRELACFFSVRVQGHTQFIRPLVNPMTQAAAAKVHGKLHDEDEEYIKARVAATENYGNFFAQNTFVASAGTLLVVGTFDSLGYSVSAVDIAKTSIPVAIIALLMVAASNIWFDHQMAKKYGPGNIRGGKP